jgi:alpha-ribazole phosphatase
VTLTLYFLRHGQTAYSKTGGYCGTSQNDPGLTAAGHAMAESFAKTYGHLDWTAIYSSPLSRALETVQPLCEKTGIAPRVHDGLREIAYGQWEGLHPTEVDRRFHDEYVRWLTDPAWNAPTGGERGVDIARRASQVLEELERQYTRGNMLLVSHKATIRILLCVLMGIDIGRYRDRFSMPVAGLSVVELSDRGPLFHSLADRAYLSEKLRSLPCT